MKYIFEEKIGGSITVNGKSGEVHGFDENDIRYISIMNSMFYTSGTLKIGCTDITGSWPPAKTKSEEWADYQALAKIALSESDVVVNRISEGVSLGATTLTTADVVAFMQWRKDVRAILSMAQPTTIPTILPVKPPYPAGT